MPAGSILLKPYDLKPAKTKEEKELLLTVAKGLQAKQMNNFHTWSSHQVKINVEDTPSHLQSYSFPLLHSTTPKLNRWFFLILKLLHLHLKP